MPKQAAFLEAAHKIVPQNKKVQDALNKVLSFCDAEQFDEAYDASLDLIHASEKLAILTRALPFFSGHPLSGDHIEENILRSATVEIRVTKEGWFEMSFPSLLPKKESGSAEFVRGFLYPAMRRYFSNHPRVRFNDSVVVFRHIYDRHRPEREYRDHDNIELNAVVDVLAVYLMEGDAPLRCFHYYCTAAGDSDQTEVIVLPKVDFLRWLASQKNFKTEDCYVDEKPP